MQPRRLRPQRGWTRRGFTFIELVVVVAIAAILMGVAAPRVLRTSARVAVGDARARVTSTLSAARAASVRYGRVSYLVLDAAGDRLLVRVDTSALGGGVPATLAEVDFWDDFRVNLGASQPLLCFDPRGIAVAGGMCTGEGVTVFLEREDVADSLVVGSTGRISP